MLILSSCSQHADEQQLEEKEIHLSVGEDFSLPKFQVTSSSQKHGQYNPEDNKMTIESTENKLRYIKLESNIISVSKLYPSASPDDKLIFTQPLLIDSVEVLRDDDKLISLRSAKKHIDSNSKYFVLDWVLNKSTQQISMLKKIYIFKQGDVDVSYEATVYEAEVR
ncbi:hypothetical protein GCM10027345_24610 [Hymenobacter daeguensis]